MASKRRGSGQSSSHIQEHCGVWLTAKGRDKLQNAAKKQKFLRFPSEAKPRRSPLAALPKFNFQSSGNTMKKQSTLQMIFAKKASSFPGSTLTSKSNSLHTQKAAKQTLNAIPDKENLEYFATILPADSRSYRSFEDIPHEYSSNNYAELEVSLEVLQEKFQSQDGYGEDVEQPRKVSDIIIRSETKNSKDFVEDEFKGKCEDTYIDNGSKCFSVTDVMCDSTDQTFQMWECAGRSNSDLDQKNERCEKRKSLDEPSGKKAKCGRIEEDSACNKFERNFSSSEVVFEEGEDVSERIVSVEVTQDTNTSNSSPDFVQSSENDAVCIFPTVSLSGRGDVRSKGQHADSNKTTKIASQVVGTDYQRSQKVSRVNSQKEGQDFETGDDVSLSSQFEFTRESPLGKREFKNAHEDADSFDFGGISSQDSSIFSFNTLDDLTPLGDNDVHSNKYLCNSCNMQTTETADSRPWSLSLSDHGLCEIDSSSLNLSLLSGFSNDVINSQSLDINNM